LIPVRRYTLIGPPDQAMNATAAALNPFDIPASHQLVDVLDQLDRVLIGDTKLHEHLVAQFQTALLQQTFGKQHVPPTACRMESIAESNATDFTVDSQTWVFIQGELLLQFFCQICNGIANASETVASNFCHQFERILVKHLVPIAFDSRSRQAEMCPRHGLPVIKDAGQPVRSAVAEP
jgi:hypothetical protein